MIERRKTRSITIGGIGVGSEHPVSIQSMTTTETADIISTIDQMRCLEEAGCEIVRLAVKTPEDAGAITLIKGETRIPVVADIHFDYRLAIMAIESGADKIRINPGNIRSEADVDKVISAAAERSIPIRIGVNSGSLAEMSSARGNPADVMVDSVMRYLDAFHKRNFKDIVISLKASSVPLTVEAYRKISSRTDYPLHVGVTAAGPPSTGIIKSSMGIGSLLLDGIGDTIRVSLTGNPVPEVYTAKKILAGLGLRTFGPEIIACPTCGRCRVDLAAIVEELEKEVERICPRGRSVPGGKNLIIAVMGCEVNGPGEAKEADIGIAFGKGRGAIFRDGCIVRTVDASVAIKELVEMIEEEL